MTHPALHLPTPAANTAPTILTPRLALLAITPEMLRADFTNSPDFSSRIDAEVPSNWPPEGWDQDAYRYLLERMEHYPDFHGWSRYILTQAAPGVPRRLAGGCGLLDPVELNTDPEIGYGLLPESRGCGYATEAVTALLDWIFQHPHIVSVNAQTFPHLKGSLRVLVKNGFQSAGAGREPGTILFRKWRPG